MRQARDAAGARCQLDEIAGGNRVPHFADSLVQFIDDDRALGLHESFSGMCEHQVAQLAEEPLVASKPPRIGEFRVGDGPSFINRRSFAADHVLAEQRNLGFAIAVNPLVATVCAGLIDHTEHFDIRVRSVGASAGRAVESDRNNVIAMCFEQSRDDRINHDKPLRARQRPRAGREARQLFVGH